MPAIIPVVAAVAADAVAAAAIGTAVTVGITASTVFSVIGAVGATLGAVGAVAHVKGLQTAGMIIGGIGAVGGIASAAGLFSSAADAGTAGIQGAGDTTSSIAAGSDSAFGNVTSDAANAATYGPTSAFETTAPATGAAGVAADTGPIDFVNNALAQNAPTDVTTLNDTAENVAPPPVEATNAPKVVPDVTAGSSDINGSASDTGLINSSTSPSGQTLSPTDTTASTQLATTNTNLPQPTGPGTSAAPDLSKTLGDVAKGAAGTNDSGTTLGGIFDGVLKFVNNNKLVSYGLLQTAGSLLGGATSTLTPAQVNALNGQAAANQAAASLSEMQQRNLAMPKAVAVQAPVTGTVASLPPPGMINSAPRLAPVTGVPG